MPVDCETIDLIDANLLAAVRDKLEIPDGPISPEAALTLTSLHAGGGVESLQGIECFSNLASLILYAGPKLDDLGPLASLSALVGLHVYDGNVTDIGPLAGLLGLSLIVLHDNPIQDFSPLTAHPALSYITIEGAHPLDLLPFATMPELTQLTLNDCGLDDLTTLTDAPKLVELAVVNNVLGDLSGLEGVSTLTNLNAGNNAITSITALAGLAELVDVGLGSNEITSLKPLAGALKLRSIVVDNNPLASLAGLEKLPVVEHISAETTGISALLPISPKTLTSLWAAENNIADVTPLAGHQVLGFLGLRSNKVPSLAPIADAMWLSNGCVTINVGDNPLDAPTLDDIIPDLCALANMTLYWEAGECYPDAMRCGISDP